MNNPWEKLKGNKKTAQILQENLDNIYPGEATKRESFIRVNELLSYGIGESNVHIHLTPEKGANVGVQLLKDGLIFLAKIVENNHQVDEITATSWIIANKPKILEMLGFTVDGEIDEEMRKKHFSDETRAVWKAHMNKKEFLDKYSKIGK